MSLIDELLLNNARYAENFDKGNLPGPPARKLAVVACMDARLDPHLIRGFIYDCVTGRLDEVTDGS
jgi:carbonic anhydrase